MRQRNYDNDPDRMRIQQAQEVRRLEIETARTENETHPIRKQEKEQEREIDRSVTKKDRRKKGLWSILIGCGIAVLGIPVSIALNWLAGPDEGSILAVGVFSVGLLAIGNGIWQIARSFMQKE